MIFLIKCGTDLFVLCLKIHLYIYLLFFNKMFLSILSRFLKSNNFFFFFWLIVNLIIRK